MRDPLPTRVFKDVSTDLFQFGQLKVLVYVDHLSGWPVVHGTMIRPPARFLRPLWSFSPISASRQDFGPTTALNLRHMLSSPCYATGESFGAI